MEIKKKRKKKGESTLLQDKIWKLCRKYIHSKYPPICYTCYKECGKNGKNKHTGHYIPKRALNPYLKYDPRVLRPQCYHCNMNLGGMGADYHIHLVKEMGQDHVDGIHRDRDIVLEPNEALEHYKKVHEWYTLELNK